MQIEDTRRPERDTGNDKNVHLRNGMILIIAFVVGDGLAAAAGRRVF